MSLVIDLSNVYKRVSSVATNYVYAFFKYINYYKTLYTINEVYYAVDSDHYAKASLDESYKANREHARDPNLELIKSIIVNLPHHNLILRDGLEADDVAYDFCKKHDGTTCISDDRDWLINLTAGENIKVLRKKRLISKYNVVTDIGYPVEKIRLYLFLQGDSKDNVKKPFKVKSHKIAMEKYNTPEEYCLNEGVTPEILGKYPALLFPIEGYNYEMTKGIKSESTIYFIRKYRLNFLNPSFNERELF